MNSAIGICMAFLFLTLATPGFANDAKEQEAEAEKKATAFRSFERGEIRLTCRLPCSGSWGSNRRELKALHSAGLWRDLAARVVEIGYNGDLAYFYLGAAAEGMNLIAQADTYYRHSSATPSKCAGLFNNCDGFTFPKDAIARLDVLASKAIAPIAKAPVTVGSSVTPQSEKPESSTERPLESPRGLSEAAAKGEEGTSVEVQSPPPEVAGQTEAAPTTGQQAANPVAPATNQQPTTPGPARGYRPVIDTKGVDMAKLEGDLKDCQAYADQVAGPGRGAVAGAVGGAALGFLLSRTLSGPNRWNSASARAGGVTGAASGAAAGVANERGIITRCMAGRGYKVLN